MNALADYLSRFDYAAVAFTKGPTGHLELAAGVNDRPARLFLDTGAGRTVFDATRAVQFGLPRMAEAQCAGGLGATGMTACETTVAHFVLGPIDERDFAATLVDLSHVNQALEARGDRPVDGVVGADILEAREAVIDYKHSRLFLKRGVIGRRAA